MKKYRTYGKWVISLRYTKVDHAQKLKSNICTGKNNGKTHEGPISRSHDQKQLFSPEQQGFMKGKSCNTQLLEFLEDLTEALDAGKDADVIYLDFQKHLTKCLKKDF